MTGDSDLQCCDRNAVPAKEIAYGIGDCLNGTVLVACSNIGIRALLLGDDGDHLVRRLHKALPCELVVERQGNLAVILNSLLAAIDGGAGAGSVCVDLSGTAIQRHAWKALWGIPIVETRTYGWLASAAKSAAACRATTGASAVDVLAHAARRG